MRDDDITQVWRAKIADIGGQEYQRLRHAGLTRCRDCAVLPGQIHVEPCCVERCPRCHVGQYITCSCHAAAARGVQ